VDASRHWAIILQSTAARGSFWCLLNYLTHDYARLWALCSWTWTIPSEMRLDSQVYLNKGNIQAMAVEWSCQTRIIIVFYADFFAERSVLQANSSIFQPQKWLSFDAVLFIYSKVVLSSIPCPTSKGHRGNIMRITLQDSAKRRRLQSGVYCVCHNSAILLRQELSWASCHLCLKWLSMLLWGYLVNKMPNRSLEQAECLPIYKHKDRKSIADGQLVITLHLVILQCPTFKCQNISNA